VGEFFFGFPEKSSIDTSTMHDIITGVGKATNAAKALNITELSFKQSKWNVFYVSSAQKVHYFKLVVR